MKKIIFFSIIFTAFVINAGSIEDRLREVQQKESQNNVTAESSVDTNSISEKNDVQKKQKVELPPAAAEDKVLLESAVNYYNSGNMTSALKKLEDLEKTYPQSPYLDQAALWKARIYNRQGKIKEALDSLKPIEKDSGEYPSALYLAGKIYFAGRRYEGAKDFFFKLSSMFPGNDLADDSLVYLAKIYLAEGDGGRALETTVQIITNYPDRDTADDAYFMLGQIYMKDKSLQDLQRARAVFKKFIYKAEKEKDPVFASSPLLARVKKDYEYLNKYYFNEGF